MRLVWRYPRRNGAVAVSRTASPVSGNRASLSWLARARHLALGLLFALPPVLSVNDALAQSSCTVDADCNDGNVCNGTETCLGGTCTAGSPLDCDDGNPCTTDGCDLLFGCTHPLLPDGSLCTDADLCNGTESCQGGTCSAGPALDCNDGNPCTTDSCNSATGCQNAPLADATPCEDGNVCNGNESCQAGFCVAGVPLGCDDGNPCTADTCDPATGCGTSVLPNGSSCADADLCNGTETCQGGTCTAAPPLDCSDGNPCTTDSCNPATGCLNSPLLNGSPCADGNACNGNETCQSGACAAGVPLACDDANPCTIDACDPLSGCTATSLPDGSSCSDGDICNGMEICQSGACAAGTSLTCDDGNVCTTESCDPILGCRTTIVPDGVWCTDGDLCNGTETCQGGFCTAGIPLTCNDANPCTADGCDPIFGCTTSSLPDGTSCVDGNVCNGDETCQSGACAAGSPLDCDDADSCTADSCTPLSGCQNTPVPGCRLCAVNADCSDGNPCTGDLCTAGVCGNPALPNGASCSDGNVCNGDETCQSGICTIGSPVTCNDANPCTADGCHPLLGCTTTPVANGTSCSDGNVCNGAEACQSGLCTAGTPLSCNDANACTADGCHPLFGCTTTPLANGSSCADANACNGNETCQSGVCTAGSALLCDDGNPCTTDSCSPLTGCTGAPVLNGTSCSDGNVCNGDEVCQSGTCAAGSPLVCDDGDPCTADICNAIAGCQTPFLPNGSSCADANPCNGTETCQSGACTAGPAPGCNDNNPCTTDSCSPVTGCQHVPLLNGTPCIDGNVCNGTETCQSATCTQGPPLGCNDGDPCTADSCNPISGCFSSSLPNGSSCADGNVCNGDESCQGGACTVGVPLTCDDGNVCTTDGCHPLSGCTVTPAFNGTSCSDGNICNGIETCQSAICAASGALNCNDGNACTTDLCDPIFGCTSNPVPNGAPCTDGNVCNGDETCQGGSCVAGAPLDCDDGDSCTADACTPLSGCQNTPVPGCRPCAVDADCADGSPCTADVCTGSVCSNTALPNGSACADGNLCNGDETCLSGACTAGTPLGCSDGNPCTADSCAPGSGCANTPMADGSSCADTTLCNGDETCQGGTCTAGTPLICDDGNVCTTDACDALTGCRATPVANGTSCADGNACNGNETCLGGTCLSGVAPDCNDGNLCTTDSCDPTTGCQNLGVSDGTSCSDGDVCNGDEACQAGACIPGTVLNCNDGNGCTTDRCNRISGCITTPVADGNLCPDADLCNGTETCQAGVCTAGVAPGCNDANVCTADSCDSVFGCVNAPVANGTSCGDGDVCNGIESCQSGTCSAGTPLACDDGNSCTTDGCDAAFGCTTTVASDGTACADGDLCNGDEACLGGACVAGAALVCDDGSPCTTDACNPLLGCTVAPVANGTSCSDGDVCNGDETCQAGLCTAAPALDCDDGNSCTVDTCDPVFACANTPAASGSPCPDGDLCNGDETCLAGICTASAPLDCNDANACTTDMCTPLSGCQNTPLPGCQACVADADCNDGNPCTADACAGGQCSNASLPNGQPCADANACNGTETCQLGFCTAGTPPMCSDGNPCTADSCHPILGCQMSPLPNGASCTDGDLCNGDETCQGGVCAAGPPPACDDGDPCTVGSCDPVAGCQAVPVIDGTLCPDGDFCNGDEFCQGGVCTAGPPRQCNDGNPCTVDSCDPVLGCGSAPAPDGSSCTDGNACNGDETCQGGVCSAGTPLADGAPCPDANVCNGDETCLATACLPGTPPTCDDGDACTADGCNAVAGCVSSPIAGCLLCSVNADCVDGSVCNGTETCQAGRCAQGTPLFCDDGSPCTIDSCDAVLGCQTTSLPDGAPCPDGNLCNGDETCQAGACTGGTPLTCNDGNVCTADTCSPFFGCTTTPISGCRTCSVSADCSDGSVCNGNETCQGGVCAAGIPLLCNDGNPCTTNSCDPVLGCRSVPVANGFPCPDGDVCNGAETCLSGVCVFGAAPNCNDGNACTTDSCSAIFGCSSVYVPGCQPCSVDADCGDSNVCDGNETCQAGVCVAGTALVCNDGNPCTIDSCNPMLGCESDPLVNGATCSDGNVCNGAETCQGGLCAAGTPLACGDSNPCTADTCDPILGCRSTQLPNGASCNDSSVCNGAETCQGGTCTAGAPLACNDGDSCTIDACNSVTGCFSSLISGCRACTADIQCTDGNLCNGNETCQGNLCVLGAPPVCNDGNVCTSDTCNPGLGCVNTPVPNGVLCNDNNFCTAGEICSGGVCGGGSPANNGLGCGDGNICTVGETCSGGVCGGGISPDCSVFNSQCTVGVCNATTGTCQAQATNNGGACNDGDLCTVGETCSGGTCTGGVATDCSALDWSCTVGVCNPSTGKCEAKPAKSLSCDIFLATQGEDVRIVSSSLRANAGFALALGDLTRDGINDLVIGSPLADGSGGARRDSGEVAILFGQPELPSTLSNAAAERTFYGATSSANLGHAVAVADIDGDGTPDLIMGAPKADTHVQGAAGAVYVFYGGLFRLPPEATVDLDNTAADVAIFGGQDTGRFGTSLATGDFNGDGLDDIAIGAAQEGAQFGREKAGMVYILFGQQGLGSGVEFHAGTLPPFSVVTAAVIGAEADARAGRTLAAGDVNGDGVSDLLIGSVVPDAEPLAGSGNVYVIFGGHPGLQPNGALPIEIDLGSIFQPSLRIGGAMAGDDFGRALGVADINGDQIGEILIGAPRSTFAPGHVTGRAYAIFGRSFVSGTAIDLANEAADVTLAGPHDGAELGASVSGGDLNGDGFDDWVVGASKADRFGQAYRILGRSLWSGLGVVGSLTQGARSGDNAGAVTLVGDVNGDGIADMVTSSPLFDGNPPSDATRDAGAVYVVFGAQGPQTPSPSCVDSDLDLFSAAGRTCGPADCNDQNGAVSPGASEMCTDGIDNNCDGLVDFQSSDADGDGFPVQFEPACAVAVDCNDNDPAVSPLAVENCIDGIDNNCNLLVDRADPACTSGSPGGGGGPPTTVDADRDGWPAQPIIAGAAFDCDDSDPDINPGEVEICTDGTDNNCDGVVDTADPICAVPPSGGNPTPPGSTGEICGNCVDDDGDGLSDLIDPTCALAPLRLESATLRSVRKEPTMLRQVVIKGSLPNTALLDGGGIGVQVALALDDGTSLCVPMERVKKTKKTSVTLSSSTDRGITLTLKSNSGRATFLYKHQAQIPLLSPPTAVAIGLIRPGVDPSYRGVTALKKKNKTTLAGPK